MSARKHGPGGRSAPRGKSTPADLGRRDAVLLFLAFAGLGALVYAPALSAPFISDDNIYLPHNPWVQEITLENVWAMLDPGSSNNLVTANYAPTQMFVHMAQWAAFGRNTLGYHVSNLLLHALIGVLFAALLMRSGAPRATAALGAGFLLFHPASAEVASWISQIKTLLAMALLLGALQLRDRSAPLAGTLFLLGLFAKPMAAVALPFVCAQEWVRSGDPGAGPVDRVTLTAWSAVFVAFAGVALFAYQAANVGIPPIVEDPWLRSLSIATFGARYLVMAVGTYGVSAWQEPPTASGLGDPWVWLALLLGGALAWRLVYAGRERLPEFPYWIWAAAAFVPVSQLMPFRYPMADRYLYFILPGLIGGVWFAGAKEWSRVPETWRPRAGRALTVVALLVVGLFAFESRGRAVVWSEPSGPTLDAIARWPDGAQAHRERGRAAVYRGSWDHALPQLEVAAERRVLTLPHILEDPILGPQMGHARFQPLLRRIARLEIELLTSEPQTTEYGLIRLAQAQLINREFEAAETSLLNARELDGSYEGLIGQMLALARAHQPFVPSVAPSQ